MANLMVDYIISLDGYGGAEGWPGYWGMESPEYLGWIEQDEGREHTVLMGATTYRLMSGFAAEMGDDPGFAALNALPKVVFSSTLEAPLEWANSELVGTDPADQLRVRPFQGCFQGRGEHHLGACIQCSEAGVVTHLGGESGHQPVRRGTHQHRVLTTFVLLDPAQVLRALHALVAGPSFGSAITV